LSSIEAHLCCLEEELRVITSSEKDVQQCQQKILDEIKELLKQNETLDHEVSKLREEVDIQKKTLASIHAMLENLKTNRGDVVKVIVKVEKAVHDNAWNMSHQGCSHTCVTLYLSFIIFYNLFIYHSHFVTVSHMTSKIRFIQIIIHPQSL
jgi:hypothetical protein